MSDKEFDKHFSKKLNEDLSFPFNSQDWENLSKRLRKNTPQSLTNDNGRWQSLWLLALLLLLGSGLIFSLINLNNLKKENQNLSQQLSEIKFLVEKNNILQNDPAKISSIRDTVFIIKYLPQPNIYFSDKSPMSSQNRASTTPPSVSEPFLHPSEPTERSAKNTEPLTSNTLLVNDLNDRILSLSSIIEQLNARLKETEQLLSTTQKSDSLKNKITGVLITPVPTQTAKTPEIITPAANPVPSNRFFVGLSGGMIYYKSKWFNRDNIEISRSEQSWQAGLRAEYVLNQRWRLMFGGDFCPFDIKINWSDGRYNMPTPPLADYPASLYALKSRLARQELVQGFIGVKHIFSYSRWRPFIGVAHTTMKILPFETTFNFQDLRTGQLKSVAVPSDGKLISNLILLNGGWEWQVNKNWSLQAEGFYYRDIHKTKKTFDQYGIRMSMMRGF